MEIADTSSNIGSCQVLCQSSLPVVGVCGAASPMLRLFVEAGLDFGPNLSVNPRRIWILPDPDSSDLLLHLGMLNTVQQLSELPTILKKFELVQQGLAQVSLVSLHQFLI